MAATQWAGVVKQSRSQRNEVALGSGLCGTIVNIARRSTVRRKPATPGKSGQRNSGTGPLEPQLWRPKLPRSQGKQGKRQGCPVSTTVHLHAVRSRQKGLQVLHVQYGAISTGVSVSCSSCSTTVACSIVSFLVFYHDARQQETETPTTVSNSRPQKVIYTMYCTYHSSPPLLGDGGTH